jgi:hypothetical protein
MTTKVILMHHQWTGLQVFLICLSLAGMLLFFYIMSASTNDFIGVANVLYGKGEYWVYGFFTIIFFAPMWDVTVYYLVYFFKPTREMIFREIENEVIKSIVYV